MQARIMSEGDVVIVRLVGRVDIEAAVLFRKACFGHLVDKKVVFDFRGLSFVGSSGILPFLETLQELSLASRSGFKFSGVCSEFQRVLSATPLRAIEIFPDEVQALNAFQNPRVSVAAPVSVEAVPVKAEGQGEEPLLQFRSVPEDEGDESYDEGSGEEPGDLLS